MSQPSYPAGPEVKSFLESHELTVSTALNNQLNRAAAAAKAFVEQRTRRVFLPVTEARTFDPPTNPGGVLDLRADLAALTSVVYAGTTLTSGAGGDCQLESLTHQPPYSRLRFVRRWYAPLNPADRQRLVITGTWGYDADGIPDDVWEALRCRAAVQVFGQVVFANTGGLTSWQEKNRSENYGANPLGALKTSWQEAVDQVITDYTRHF